MGHPQFQMRSDVAEAPTWNVGMWGTRRRELKSTGPSKVGASRNAYATGEGTSVRGKTPRS
jgi:hypothetical protein